MLAPRPKGKKKAKQDLGQLVLQSRQIAATEELTRVTKKKVEAMEKSNEIDIMLAKPVISRPKQRNTLKLCR